jgi:DNA polymerase I-like protein with 3'-5' exonuclease and polymerase domains
LPKWHERMATEIINSGGYYRLPSGKEFYYPDIKRFPTGGFTNRTQIANYPVQFFATGELLPMVIIDLWKALKVISELKSCIILSVHDSIEIDCHPDEIEVVTDILKQSCESIKELYKERFDYDLKIPIEWEYKLGDNWLQMEEIK